METEILIYYTMSMWNFIWNSFVIANDRLNKLQQETAAQAAERILQAIISGNNNQASEALV